ncbi:MAG: hypothetical protein QOG87_915 [Actinomycetota bacterium]
MTLERRRGGRKWVPLVSVAVAYVMIATLLPNPLRIPTDEATATAEFAPVVGKRTNQSGGSLSETGFASSEGLGSGGDGLGEFGLGLDNPLAQLPSPVSRPRQKTCYGDPPRQAEDPLSPPCVAFFEGDNGGATYPGVTGDKVTAVMYDGLSDIPDGEDMCKPYSDEDSLSTRTLKAMQNYFQKRYQTYGRRVCIVKQADSGVEDVNRKGDAIKTVQEYNPFAVMSFAEPNDDEYLKQISKQGVTSFGLNFFQPQSYYEQNSPLAFSFFDTREEHAEITAAYICEKLIKNKVTHTDDPTLRGQTRRVGLIYNTGAESAGGEDMAPEIKRRAKQKCGFEFAAEFKYPYDATTSGGAGNSQAIADMRNKNINTVFMMSYADAILLAQQTASNSAYFPEWFVNSTSVLDVGPVARVFSDPRQKTFGVSLRWRTPGIRETFWYQAYQSEQPNTLAEARWGFSWYYLLLNLFTAVQAAGPKLTPDAIARGMFTFKTDQLDNPYVPSGEYGEPADYAFVSSYMEFFWDPRGTPPDGNPSEGCVRVTNEGRRFRPGGVGSDESGLFNPASPCTADIRLLQDGVGA